jgi:tRNA U34 2-thiouridine synthase MnmA/TrmU
LPQRAVTPGQYIAFYNGTQCLGGAQIESSMAGTSSDD